MDLVEPASAVGKVAQAKGKGYGGKMVWRKGQLEGITFDGLFDSAGLGLGEQGGREVEADNFCGRESFLKKEGDIA
jgi:hypothetical protein